MTPEMLAAGWAVLRRQKPIGSIFGPGPALAEAYEAMRALEPRHEILTGGPPCPTCGLVVKKAERAAPIYIDDSDHPPSTTE